MTLAEWDQKVSPHLQFIEAGCQMAARHARMLPLKPSFETKAQDELAKVRAALEASLAEVVAAQSTYSSKPVSHV